MFQMNCSNCGGIIKSPLLVEVQVIECPQCEKIVGIKNVIVSKKKFSISLRSSLKKLLLAARDKFRLNKSHVVDAQSSYEIDKRIAKLLRRDDFRLDVSYDIYVQINFDGHKRLAKLLNISPIGAGIEFAEGDLLPDDNAEIGFELPLPGDAESLTLHGRVVWRKIPAKDTLFPCTTMGLQFKDVDEATNACLWDFIVNSETSANP